MGFYSRCSAGEGSFVLMSSSANSMPFQYPLDDQEGHNQNID